MINAIDKAKIELMEAFPVTYRAYINHTLAGDFSVELNNKIQLLQSQVSNMRGLLDVAKCPNCDGSGAVIVSGSGYEVGCCGNTLPNGERCGNAIPIETEVQELEQCQWCCEKEALEGVE